MAKYLILVTALAATLVLVDSASAGHRRRGCPGGHCHVGHHGHHGGYYGGCPGGVCGVPVSGDGYAADVVDAAPAVAEAPVVIRTQPAPRYTSFRRGLFGWRRS